jgi:hypothetical protein
MASSFRLTSSAARNLACAILRFSFAPQLFLTALVFDGDSRFPDLRGGVIELGAGWVLQFLPTPTSARDLPALRPQQR